jgi:hypothetical protein
MDHALQEINNLVNSPSPFLHRVADAASAVADALKNSRALTKFEIDELQAKGCHAVDWHRVRASTPGMDVGRFANCTFVGDVVFGSFEGELAVFPGVAVPTGLYNSTIVDSVVESNSLVQNTTMMAKTLVRSSSAVMGCGSVVCSGSTTFGNGILLPVGVEIGGRDVPCYAEMTLSTAVAVGANRSDPKPQASFFDAVKKYSAAATSQVNIFEPGSRILNCPRVVDAFVGTSSILEGSEVESVTLLSDAKEPVHIHGGARVRNALLQWGCDIDTMSVVNNALMCEHSDAERHAKVLDSIIGPNSGVAEGEVTSCLVGPFVGFHHQALLIACFWPSGKGNVGYGANVGSNHTLKAPDQELWPGEGNFFGLGICIKYPSNFVQAPYTVFATGITTLPQTLTMPFSLVNGAGEIIPTLSPAFNEISPGWVLSDALFSVLRNDSKFASRNKATRNAISPDVFRPEIVDMMEAACERLAGAEGKAKLVDGAGNPVFTDKECSGIGKNYMKEASRAKAVEAYKFFCRYYALRGLYNKLVGGGVSADAVLTAGAGDDARWAHELSTLVKAYGVDTLQQAAPKAMVARLMHDLAAAQREVAESAELSKSRDDKRGVKTIPDYDDVHSPASEEKVVVAANVLAGEIATFAEGLGPAVASGSKL